MPRIVVRKCPWSGKLFEDDAKYVAHLDNLRAKQREQRELVRLKKTFKRKIAPLYKLDSLDKIQEWLNENIYWICAHQANISASGPRTKKPRTTGDTISIEFIRPVFNKACRTSHSAPFGQKNTGWYDEHITEHGWTGSILISFTGDGYYYFDSNYLCAIGINTGSGGGGSRTLKYGLTLFAKDFKGLARAATLEKLARE
jgi:uncharacterized C2H2 Zn-finger protein